MEQPLLSRAAESVFWCARYVERAENIARILDVNQSMSLDAPALTESQWLPLIQVMSAEEPFAERYPNHDRENVIKYLTFDTTHPDSILSCLSAARENARSVREIISSEMWEHLNTFYVFVRDSVRKSSVRRDPYHFCRQVKTSAHLMEGLANATMSHNEAWHFSVLGRMVERADMTSRILDVKYFVLLPNASMVGNPVDEAQWGAVLRSCSGFEMYRKAFGQIVPAHIVKFLLLDHSFPRSVLFCLKEASDSLYAITGTQYGTFSRASERLLNKAHSQLSWDDADEIIAGGLHEYLDNVQELLIEIGNAIHHDFFAPTLPAMAAAARLE